MACHLRPQVMSKVIHTHQVMSWLCKKYFRFIFFGAVTSCAFFNLALHSGAGLYYYCQQDCLETLMIHPLSPLDSDVIKFISDNYIDPPFPKGSYKGDFQLDNPPWGKLGKWGEAQKFLVDYFGRYDKPGRFVEIGAQDGEFMSLSLWLEQVKHFEGVLIEPNPVDYPKLRAKKRSAYSANVCASPLSTHQKDYLWLRDIPENLPPLLNRIQQGSNRLLKYVAIEDRELGKDVPVQCFNTGAIIYAALKSFSIDFLTISTHGGELDILMSLPPRVQIRVLSIVAPIASGSEDEDLKKITDDRGLKEIHRKGNIHIFIPANEVKVV